ncbi:NCS cytosine-purine permease [Fomitopsis betulina]|nr:NCS cytosine-purine permease [Fomitopsis betulina]
MSTEGKLETTESEKDAESLAEDLHENQLWAKTRWRQQLLRWGVEERGILPVPPSQRTDTHYSKVFFVFFSANCNILSFSAGTLGPMAYGLGLRDTCLVILFFNLLASIPPAYLATFGPRLGLRQMCQARYSFGYFGVIIMSIFNMATYMGYNILNCILGGQTLSSVSSGHLTWTVGIVIIALISLFVSFCGYRVLIWYERLVWIPVFVAYLVAVGIGGKHLNNPPPEVPATAADILSFASVIAGFVISYAPLSSDYTLYYTPDVPTCKVFTWTYIGLNVPVITLQCLGASLAIAAPSVPAWNEGYTNGNVGGLLEAVLSPVGNFGKFLTVMLALSATGNIAMTLYSFCMSFQVFIPQAVYVPRYFFSVLATAIIIPLAIVGQHKFYDTLSNFLGLIAYWSSAYCAVVITEHLVIRRASFATYDLRYWNDYRRLPLGLAAIGACVLSVGLIVPSMDQVWYVGPIARVTGDIGFELAFVTTALCYVPLRMLELRHRKLV